MLIYTDINRFGMFHLHLWVFMTKNGFVANMHLCSKYAFLCVPVDSRNKKGQE